MILFFVKIKVQHLNMFVTQDKIVFNTTMYTVFKIILLFSTPIYATK